MNLSFEVQSSNISSMVTFYDDTRDVRISKIRELEKIVETHNTFTDKEFENYSFYSYDFDWLLIHSLFISCFSYFEVFMRNTAIRIQHISKSKIKLTDLNGNGNLDCYRKYISHIGEIKSAENESKLWIELMEYKAVRNSLIHSYGKIKKPLKVLDKYNSYTSPTKTTIRLKDIQFLKNFEKTSIIYMKRIAEEFEIKKEENSFE